MPLENIKYIKDEVLRWILNIFDITSNLKTNWEQKNVNQSCKKSKRRSLTTVRLIRSILTVVFLVTGPAQGNTAAARTRKEVHRTIMLPFLCGKKVKGQFYYVTSHIFYVLWEWGVSACWCVKRLTRTVSFIREVSAVIGAITAPGGGVAERSELTPLEGHAFHTKQIVTGAVSGAWKRRYQKIVSVREKMLFCVPHNDT